MMHFLNLTNGIAWASAIKHDGLVRIQSTACEQKLWSDIIADLDYSFLIPLAMGRPCVIYDCGARKETSRAIWQGVEFIRAASTMRWMGRRIPVIWRGHDASVYAHQQIARLDRRAKSRLDYAGRFLATSNLSLRGVSVATTHDGDYEQFADLLRAAS